MTKEKCVNHKWKTYYFDNINPNYFILLSYPRGGQITASGIKNAYQNFAVVGYTVLLYKVVTPYSLVRSL